MRRATALVTLALATCVGVGTWLVGRPTSQEHETSPPTAVHAVNERAVNTSHQQPGTVDVRQGQPDGNEQQVLAMSQRIAQLEQRHRDLLQELHALARLQPGLSRVEARPAGGQPTRPSKQDDVRQFEHSFWQQPQDPVWTRDVVTSMATTLDELRVADTVLDRVQCQERACRIEFRHPGGTGDAAFIETVHASEAFRGEFYIESTRDPGGQRRTLVYLARPGESLFPKHNPRRRDVR